MTFSKHTHVCTEPRTLSHYYYYTKYTCTGLFFMHMTAVAPVPMCPTHSARFGTDIFHTIHLVMRAGEIVVPTGTAAARVTGDCNGTRRVSATSNAERLKRAFQRCLLIKALPDLVTIPTADDDRTNRRHEQVHIGAIHVNSCVWVHWWWGVEEAVAGVTGRLGAHGTTL
ncbi:hypothetical protein CBL_02811 [Carabus blaptoides fortunei]